MSTRPRAALAPQGVGSFRLGAVFTALLAVAEDGTVQQLDARPGMTVWRPAETHVVRNVGRTVVRTLEVEIKDGP